MSNPLQLVRPDLRDFAGYSSAASEQGGRAPTPAIKIDANEFPYVPFGPVASLCAVNRYAEPQPVALKARLAALWGVKEDQILLTSGSSQGIDLLIRLFCRAGQDEVLICPPTFGLYQIYAALQGAKTLAVPLREDGQLDLATIGQKATSATKLAFIPTPNAPLGHAMNKDDLLTLCAQRDGQSLIVADEAYAEFSDDPHGLLDNLDRQPNLVILRTLSKAYALAGERIGCVIAAPDIIRMLQRIAPAYPLAQSAVRAALDALSPAGLAQSQAQIARVRQERARLHEALSQDKRILRLAPSEGNFLFLETGDAPDFLATLARFGIQARAMASIRAGGVRLSIGTEEENTMLLRALGLPVVSQTATRQTGLQRKTKETQIDIALSLDANEPATDIVTGLGFLDHMLDQLATHGGFALTLRAQGDVQVDAHHTVEDCAIALGQALRDALGDKKGIARFGFTAPLDEALAQIVIDLSGRPFLACKADWPDGACDGISGDLVEHFLRSFATSLGATLHVTITGANRHHMIEACFKALGRALRQAVTRESNVLPSTKGAL